MVVFRGVARRPAWTEELTIDSSLHCGTDSCRHQGASRGWALESAYLSRR
jgi:hypothetical protein